MLELAISSRSMPLSLWITLGFVALVIVLIVLFAVLMFFAAWLEKVRVRALEPIDPERAREMQLGSAQVVRDAVGEGFVSLGLFHECDSSLTKGTLELLLSGDQMMLLAVRRSTLGRRYWLTTRFADEMWLVTEDVAGATDLSGLEVHEMLPGASFNVVLWEHRQRLAASGETPMIWNAQTVLEDIRAHDQARVERMMWAGLARSRGADGAWSYSMSGALRIMINALGKLAQTSRQSQRAKELAAQCGM